MSARQVRRTVQALLEDPFVGLAPTLAALAEADGVRDITTDFNFARGALSGKMKAAGQPSIAVNARSWTPVQKLSRPNRDANVVVDISTEFFNASLEQLEDQRELTVIAIVQCLDGLREYSDANGGAILDVEDPFRVSMGQFSGPVTSDGALISATILERSGT